MIDYWEAIGRLAYDKELISEFKKVLPLAGPIPWVTLRTRDASSTCLDIPKEQYENVQRFLSPILTEQHLSLFAAGELIWNFSSEKARKLFDQMHELVSQTKPELYCPSTSYFIALGLVIVDYAFREKVEESCAEALPRLSGPQRDQMANLVNNVCFQDLSAELDSLWWGEGCYVTESARAEYRHPVPLDAKECDAGKPDESWISAHA